MVLVLDSLGAHARQIASGIWLSHGDRENNIPRNDARHVALNLLLGAKAGDIRRHNAAVQRTKPVTAASISKLLDDDLLPANIVVAHPTKTLFRPHDKKTFLARFFKNFAVNNALLPEPLHVRHNLFGQKSSIGLAEHGLLVSKLPGEHSALLFSSLRGAKNPSRRLLIQPTSRPLVTL